MKNHFGHSVLLDAVATGHDRYFAALELIAAQGTAIGATIANINAVAGDSLVVRNTGNNAQPGKLLQLWTDVQVAGTARVRSPRFHDNVQGLRFDTVIGDIRPLMPWGIAQPIYPGDVLIAELGGSAVAGDVETLCLLNYYPDLPGVNGSFITAEQLQQRLVHVFTVENTLATGTGGGWTGSEAINAEFDQWRSGEQYALIGYLVDTEIAAVSWRGGDTGNLRVGGPGEETERELTADWFVRLSRSFNLPLVPVFRADNKAGILIDSLQDENGADVTVTSIFGLLAK
jgi:hypothetical protein